jgi:hypothetical protein
MDVWIDKTLFIKEILEDPSKTFRITRPSRWGKTLNMDMLKTFLEIEVDSNGERVLMPTNKYLFERTNINGDFIDLFEIASRLRLFDYTLIYDKYNEDIWVRIA